MKLEITKREIWKNFTNMEIIHHPLNQWAKKKSKKGFGKMKCQWMHTPQHSTPCSRQSKTGAHTSTNSAGLDSLRGKPARTTLNKETVSQVNNLMLGLRQVDKKNN